MIKSFLYSSSLNKPYKININDVILFVFSSVVICLLLINLLDYDYGRDQSIFDTVARTMVGGGAPYKDAWDFKTPGIYFIYALKNLIFGVGETKLRVFEICNLILLYYGFVILSKRVFSTPYAAVFPCLIATINYVLPGFWHTAQPESFAATVLVWAIVFSVDENESTTGSNKPKIFLSWVLAALLYSFAGLLKPPLGGGIIVGFCIIYMRNRMSDKNQSRYSTILPLLLAILIGGSIPVLLTCIYLYFTEALADFYQIMFLYLPNYTAISSTENGFFYLFYRANYIWLLRNCWLHLLGLLFLIGLPRFNEHERVISLHILGAILFGLIGVALQAKLFRYHFAATVSLSGLLAGWGLWKLWICIREKTAAFLPMLVLFCSLGVLPGSAFSYWRDALDRLDNLFFSNIDQDISFRLNSKLNSQENRSVSEWNMNAKANHLVADWISKNTSVESSIYVWGFEPSIYLYSNRQLASRYIYNVAQRTSWSKKGAEIELMNELDEAKPSSVVIQEGDYFRGVTGNMLDSRSALDEFQSFKRWLVEFYQPEAKIENLEIYSRK